MSKLIVTSIKLTKKLRQFMNDTNINRSSFIRDLIINSKQYKDWEKDNGRDI